MTINAVVYLLMFAILIAIVNVDFKNLSNSKIEIYISKVGRNETDITLPLELDSSLNFMGMCFDSQYCFEGGIRA